MSAEKINNTQNYNLHTLESHNAIMKDRPARVDINILIARARMVKNKENKATLIIVALFSSLIVVVGIILSF